jgi:hydroxymethylpyrimidine pyrophosphatase-like HAD family hydrolase
MSSRFLSEAFDIRVESDAAKIAYCGDSPNDAPMFAGFPTSIGVANIRPYAKLMSHLPLYVTAGEGGHGFAEFGDAVIRARMI